MAEHDITGEVKNYLGHPCSLAAAIERFSEPLTAARREDPRALLQQIGGLLTELSDRGEHLGNALRLANDSLPNDSDADDAHAVLEMAIPYDFQTANKLFKLSGCVLAALELLPSEGKTMASRPTLHGV